MFTFFLSLALTCLPAQEEEFQPNPSDRLHFGRFWKQIKLLEKEELLLEAISKRRKEINALKEHWRSKIDHLKTGVDAPFYQQIEKCFEQGSLSVSLKGSGAAYFLLDEQGAPRFVIKPIDEDILCLNNRKNYASPFNDGRFRVRFEIPLYRAAQAEALSYAVARDIGLDHITPKTVMAIISSGNFFDISDSLEGVEKEVFLQHVGRPDKEKLCSIQEYIPNMMQLYDLAQEWIAHDISDKAIEDSIDQDDFEEAIILIWILYDTDAHAGNIHVKLNSSSVYNLKKFDHGLTFPEQNKHLFNALSCIPNCLHRLSPEAQQKIRDVSVPKMVELIKEYELDESIGAFEERMEILKLLIESETMTIYEIDLRLRALELPYGKELALSDIPIEELEAQLFNDSK